jgi:hypothetical protein
MSNDRIERPDALTPEDERFLDRAWRTVSQWTPPKTGGAKKSEPVVQNRGPRR